VPQQLDLASVPSPAAYVEAVAAARRRIAAGGLQKVVLARMLVARADHALDRLALLQRLREREPDGRIFAVNGFVGASPELLVSRYGAEVRTEAVAGTARRGRNPAEDMTAAELLLASAKDRAEHALVVDAIRRALRSTCTTLSIDAEPAVAQMRSVLHLKTDVRGRLGLPALTALELAARLHPTPAVCGTPRAAAMRLIRELEPIDRALYAGMVGWQDVRGDGEWTVALRCAEVQDRLALVFAGAGIVADSDPEAELAETDAKFQSVLDALGVYAPS
jgi:isochorismate synthase